MLLRTGAGLVCKSDFMLQHNRSTLEDELGGVTGVGNLGTWTFGETGHHTYFVLSVIKRYCPVETAPRNHRPDTVTVPQH